MVKKWLPYFLFTTLFIYACSNKPREIENHKDQSAQHGEKLVHINKYLVGKDADIIRGYIKRRKWDMQVTQTGLWYKIYNTGNGSKATPGQKATLTYKVELLENGTTCYSSEETGPKIFTIGKGGVEKGLEEGILLLNEGDKATFILPPHLAHGLMGDEHCIPARAIIIYDVELIKLSD